MPTVLRIDGFRFFFYSTEGTEPPHIHIENGDNMAKFWLLPIELDDNHGFSNKEINQLRKLVTKHQEHLINSWNEYFN